MNTHVRSLLAQKRVGRPAYLRVVPPPGPVLPATPCPSWCAVEHEDWSDTFHYGDGVDVGAATIFPEIREDGTRAVQLGLNGRDGEFFNLREIDELISVLAAARATLASPDVTNYGVR